MYKEILKIYKNDFKSIDDVVEYYGRSGKLFLRGKTTDTHYELIFNRQYKSSIFLPKVTKEHIEYSPFFYLDDDNIVLDLNDMAMLTYIARFEYLLTDNYVVKHHKQLKRDIGALFRTLVNIEPYSRNNDIKIRNRIRVVKTYKIDKEGKKEYVDCFGKALWDFYIPNSEDDIKKYAKIFNDPINVANPEKGVYCFLGDEYYTGLGYYADKDSITSIYPQQANLPERLRQHYTSNYLEPIEPETDFLQHENLPAEKRNAVCIFVPVQTEYDKPFGENTPLGWNTLLAGEILINEEIAKRKYYVHRTYTTTSTDVEIVPIGTVLMPGDAITYDIEGNVDVRYDLKYENAVLDSVEERFGVYKIILRIKSELSVARLISDYGVKGVTHPRKDLGYVTLNDPDGDELSLPVEMIVGPNSMKSGPNGIRLSWLALKNALTGKEGINININPQEISAEEINKLTSDIKKVKWTYKDKKYDVYVGFMSYGVTDISKDCRSRNVKVMPETLKYMHLNELSDVANEAQESFVDIKDKWVLRELLKLKTTTILQNDTKAVWDFEDPKLKEFLNDAYFNVTSWIDKSASPVSNMLLNPMNEGMYIKVKDTYVRLPSAKIINYQTQIINSSINYPSYLIHALWFLMSIKLYHRGKSSVEKIMNNVTNYIANVDQNIFSKKAALSTAVSPMVKGGNLKQLVSRHVPKGVTVLLDKDLEQAIDMFKKRNEIKTIYENGVRNPVLWRFQLMPRELWTFAKFKKYLKNRGVSPEDVILHNNIEGAVLRNTIDTLFDQSDTDGDLFPVAAILSKSVQDKLHRHMKENSKVYDYEKKWITDYIKSEADNSKFSDIENKPFKYYKVDREWFSEAFSSASIAKMKIGMATTDLWFFHSAAEFEFVKENITKEQMQYMQFLFSRVVQDMVVRGIKHNTEGSSGYDIYSLSTFKSESVKYELTTYMDVGQEDADLFVEIAKLAKSNDQSRIICRLPSGGNYEKLSEYASMLGQIDDDIKEKHSYAKILHPFWDDLLVDANISTISEDYDENYELFTDEEGILK